MEAKEETKVVENQNNTNQNKRQIEDPSESDSATDFHHKNKKGKKNEPSSEAPVQFATIVANHYNSINDLGLEVRNISRIYYLRNFNNWTKALLINECLSRLTSESLNNLKVLDMCCGKGGDHIKWLQKNVNYLICSDIAEKSLEECKERFKFLEPKFKNGSKVECKFILADCTRVQLKTKYPDPTIQLDVVSCQFSFHYCFESLPQAECMVRNASESLKPGGFFIGTIPNANEIVKRLRKAGSKIIKNDVFSLEICCDEPYPIFGVKYNFYLEGVVNCPEFLVHFPTFERIAQKYGLKLVLKKTFDEYFDLHKNSENGYSLLRKIKALETYPPFYNNKLTAAEQEYIHAKDYVEGNKEKLENRKGRVGTISKSEWEVITLYTVFIFEKQQESN